MVNLTNTEKTLLLLVLILGVFAGYEGWKTRQYIINKGWKTEILNGGCSNSVFHNISIDSEILTTNMQLLPVLEYGEIVLWTDNCFGECEAHFSSCLNCLIWCIIGKYEAVPPTEEITHFLTFVQPEQWPPRRLNQFKIWNGSCPIDPIGSKFLELPTLSDLVSWQVNKVMELMTQNAQCWVKSVDVSGNVCGMTSVCHILCHDLFHDCPGFTECKIWCLIQYAQTVSTHCPEVVNFLALVHKIATWPSTIKQQRSK